MSKKLLLLLSLLFFGHVSWAQIILKATPVVFPKNQIINISAEFYKPAFPTYTFTIGLAPNLDVKNDLSSSVKTLKLDSFRSFAGLSIEPSIRHYLQPNKQLFEGFYTEIYSSFRYSHSNFLETKINSNSLYTGGRLLQNSYMAVVGFGIGCQFRFGAQKKFIVDLFAGVGGKSTFYKRRSLDLQNVSISNNFDNGFASRGNVSIGYIIH